jgi:putative hydrolase of the HAD superfamily
VEEIMNHIKAVIFDLDNTILDRTSTFRSFTQSFLKAYFDHLESHKTLLERIIDLDQDGYKDKSELFNELLLELPWSKKPTLSELLVYYSTEYVRSAVLMNLALEVIAHVRRKYKIGLITNGRSSIQYGKIDQLGIRDAFDFIAVSEEVGVKKPDPTIFALALNKLEVKPEECIYIGDHPVNDIEGAAAIGMETIWFRVNQPWKEGLVAKPLFTIDALSDLLKLL